MATPESRTPSVGETERTLRPGWRILIFFGLFALLAIVGQLAISTLPSDPLGWVSLTVATLAAVAAGAIVVTRFDGRAPGALGFPINRTVPRELAAGFAIGGALIASASILLLLTGSTVLVPDAGTLPQYITTLIWTLAFFTIAAGLEEVLFRGYPFQALVEWLGVWPAMLISSALFSWLHGQNPNITALAFGNIFLAGVLLALAYLKTRSLWFATAVHVGWNWVMATLFDFPVSGLTSFDTPLYTARATGPEWWTGGAFGPEAGIAGTVVLLAGIAWLWRTDRIGESGEMRALAPIVDRRLSPGQL